jgi:hypothetical protein
MPSRRLLAPVAVVAAIAGGGVTGAMLGVPGISGAQEVPDTTTETPAPEGGFRVGRGPGLDAAANALNMEIDELIAALGEGQTIAEVATAQSVDVNTVIDAMVADVLERRPDADETEVRERITQLVNEGGELGGPGHHGPGFGFRGAGLDAAANALNMELDDLVAALRDGQTIAEIAQAQGIDVNVVIDAMVAEAREKIETFVNEGPQRPETHQGDAQGETDTTTPEVEGSALMTS